MENLVLKEVKQVLQAYDFTVLSIRTESYKGKKGVWWVQTPSGYKILKKHSHSAKTLEFLIAAMEYLMDKGIAIPEIIKTKDGQKYVLLEKTCYVLSEAIDGKTLNYVNSANIKRIVQELARFHRASSGFVPPLGVKIRTHLGDWLENYQQKLEKIEKYYQLELKNNQHSKFGQIILKEYPYFLDRIETALTEFDQPAYHQWVEEVKAVGSLCHQDFTAGNLILSTSGKLFVLDTDSLTIDLPIRDIRKILHKIFKRRDQWDLGLVQDILRWYQSENPLSSKQWQVLKPAIRYPHLFVGIMRKYYEKREKTWTEEKYIKRLQEMIKLEKSIDQIVDNFAEVQPI